MKIGSLFSGAGGLDMAVEDVFGGTVVWNCELDAAASKVLEYRWGAPNHGDITKVPWDQVEPIDVLCGGWPCQPWSVAGMKKGAEDERALWPEVARAVRALRPRYVVLENVPNIIVLGELARAVGDLAQAGYDAQWVCLRASDVGAPHRRERVFIVASHPEDDRPQNQRFTGGTGAALAVAGGCSSLADADPHDVGREDAAAPGEAVSRRTHGEPSGCCDWAQYGPAIRRWESLTRPAPAPTELNRNGNPRLNPAFSEWLMGWPAGWVTEVPGLSRSDQLRIIGNGVVPQCAEAALLSLLALEKTHV